MNKKQKQAELYKQLGLPAKFDERFSKPVLTTIKPPEEIDDYIEIASTNVAEYSNEAVPPDTTHISIRNESSSWDSSVEVIFYRKVSGPNPNYKKDLEKYETDQARYKAALKEYNKNCKILKEYKKSQQENAEREQYEKLKQKFGG